jgi:hypothetical protein
MSPNAFVAKKRLVILNRAESPVRNPLFAGATTDHCHCTRQQVPSALSARIGMTKVKEGRVKPQQQMSHAACAKAQIGTRMSPNAFVAKKKGLSFRIGLKAR